jgi:hypothetical protein
MRSDPQLHSILASRHRVLADKVLARARTLDDPEKRRTLEEIARSYLKLAAVELAAPLTRISP